MKKPHYHHQKRTAGNGFFLSFIDGLEGGFAIFAGIVVGLSFTNLPRDVLIVTAIVGIVVNAVNAATIRYTTEHYLDELDGHEKRSPLRHYFFPALAEFGVYVVVSFVALLPLLFVAHIQTAVIVMVTFCLTVLFVTGAIRGHSVGRHWLRDAIEVMGGGLLMIVMGALAGWLLSNSINARIE